MALSAAQTVYVSHSRISAQWYDLMPKSAMKIYKEVPSLNKRALTAVLILIRKMLTATTNHREPADLYLHFCHAAKSKVILICQCRLKTHVIMEHWVGGAYHPLQIFVRSLTLSVNRKTVLADPSHKHAPEDVVSQTTTRLAENQLEVSCLLW